MGRIVNGFSFAGSSRKPLAAYAVNGLTPETIADFAAVSSNDPLFAYTGLVKTFSEMFTFARASKAWGVDSSGLLVEYASGVPRTDSYRYNGTSFVRKGIRLESEQRTNSCLHSRAFDNAVWSGGTAAATANQVGIDGVANTAYTLTDSSSGAIEGKIQSVTIPDNSNPVAATFFVGKTSGAATFPGILLNLTGGTAVNTSLAINTNTGTITHRTSFVPTASFIEDWSSLFWRVTIIATNNGLGNTSATVAGYPAVNTDAGTSWSNTPTGSAVFDQCDVNIGASTPSSPIITGAAAVTRAAETAPIAAAKMSYNATAMWFQMQGEMDYADNGAAAEITFYRQTATSTSHVTTALQTTGTRTGQVNFTQREPDSGVDTVSTTTTYFAPGMNVPFNIASRNAATVINGAVDGTALTANTTPTALPNLSATTFQLGFDFMGHVALFRQGTGDPADVGIEEATS